MALETLQPSTSPKQQSPRAHSLRIKSPQNPKILTTFKKKGKKKKKKKIGSRLGRRVIHFANLPIKLLVPNPPFDSVREFALKTIPSASKIEIRRVLESLYGFEIDDVRTLNMEGKKKKWRGYVAAKPDYKKAYITLKSPLSVPPDLFPIPWVQEAMQQKMAGKKKNNKAAVVEEQDGNDSGRAKAQTHWLEEEGRGRREGQGSRRGDKRQGVGWRSGDQRRRGKGVELEEEEEEEEEESKFPWSSMRSWRR